MGMPMVPDKCQQPSNTQPNSMFEAMPRPPCIILHQPTRPRTLFQHHNDPMLLLLCQHANPRAMALPNRPEGRLSSCPPTRGANQLAEVDHPVRFHHVNKPNSTPGTGLGGWVLSHARCKGPCARHRGGKVMKPVVLPQTNGTHDASFRQFLPQTRMNDRPCPQELHRVANREPTPPPPTATARDVHLMAPSANSSSPPCHWHHPQIIF